MVSTTKPRKPDSRRTRALATRRRMIEAAYRLFSEHGYSVPLTAIAIEAGVAVQTLYFTFHTKAALLQEALQMAVVGFDDPVPPHESPWFGEMAAEPDAARAIGIIVDNTIAIFERVGPLTGTFRHGDSEVVAMWAHSEQLRIDGYRLMMAALAKKARLKRGLSLEEAGDVLFVLLSPDLYQEMVGGRGWKVDRWRRWITQALRDALFA